MSYEKIHDAIIEEYKCTKFAEDLQASVELLEFREGIDDVMDFYDNPNIYYSRQTIKTVLMA